MTDEGQVATFSANYFTGSSIKPEVALPQELRNFAADTTEGIQTQIDAVCVLSQYRSEKNGADPAVFLLAFEGWVHAYYPGYHDVPNDEVPLLQKLVLNHWTDAHIKAYSAQGFIESTFFK